MADEQIKPAGPPTVEPSVAPAAATGAPAGEQSAPSYDPEYVKGLEAEAEFARQARADFERLAPYRDDIVRIVQDENAREFYRNSLKAYEQYQTAATPQMPPEFKPLADKVDRVSSFVDSYEQQQKAATENAQRQRQEAVAATVRKIGATEPWLAANNYRNAHVVAQYGDLNGISDFEEAWNAYTSDMRERYGSATPATPPRSLRAEGGSAGVPGTRGPGPIKGPSDIRDRIAASLKSQNRAG